MDTNLYKENFISLFTAIKNSDMILQGIAIVLLKQLQLKTDFSKPTDGLFCDDHKVNEFICTCLRHLTHGGDKPQWQALETITRDDQTASKLRAIYSCNDTEGKNIYDGLATLNAPAELDSLLKMIFEDFQFVKSFSVQNMKSWAELTDCMLPCTDMIIFDRYIMDDNSLLESNLFQLCKNMVDKLDSRIMNITIITRWNKVRINNDWVYILQREQIQDIKEKLKKYILAGRKHYSVKITIVSLQNNGENNNDIDTILKEHDRTIVTNYNYVHSGDSYNYFNSKGEVITHGRDLYLESQISKVTFDKTSAFIRDMQTLIEYAIRHDNNCLQEEDKFIVGDKKSSFLNFI